tara:strand:- start:27 stop:356 length:330 start_codon:yes stop_codon:yes gene_type:complete
MSHGCLFVSIGRLLLARDFNIIYRAQALPILLAKNDLSIIIKSHREYFLVGDGLQQRAAQLFIVLAVAKLTAAQVGSEINKAIDDFMLAEMGQGKLANSWGVNNDATAN